MELRTVFKQSPAYKTLLSDKQKGRLSHAYLLLCEDGGRLRDYLKFLASVIVADAENTRADRLVLAERHTDCQVYPDAEFATLNVALSAHIAADSFVMPLESDKKVYVIDGAHTMNTSAQNKLLKTLEEPPQSSVFILGAVNSKLLLPTVVSRLKTLRAGAFSEELCARYLAAAGIDSGIAAAASAISGGLPGRAEKIAGDAQFSKAYELAAQVAFDYKSVSQTSGYAAAICALSKNAPDFLTLLKMLYRDILTMQSQKHGLILNRSFTERLNTAAENFNAGALINAIEIINNTERNLAFNANLAMQAESMLIGILEGKYKWQKY